MPFLPPNQQRQSTEGMTDYFIGINDTLVFLVGGETVTADSEAQTRHVTLHSSISSCGSSIDNRRRHIHLSRTDEPGGRSEGDVQCPPLIVGRCVNAHTFDKLGVVVRTTAGAVKAIAITHHRPRRV